MNKVLVFGAKGFIGSAVAEKASDLGYEVVRYARSSIDEEDIIGLDLLVNEPTEMDFKHVDIVIYCAGIAHEVSGVSEYSSYIRLNQQIPTLIYSLCCKAQVKKFVYLSSVKAALFDQNLYQDSGIKNIYAYSKKKAESELLDISRDSYTSLYLLRPSLVYGPKVKGNLALLKKAVDFNIPLPIPEIKNRKSMVHLDDLVESLWFIVNETDLKNQVLVIAEPNSYSMREIYQQICQTSGKKATPPFISHRFLEIIASTSPSLKNKLHKMFSDDVYHSDLTTYGFKFKKSLPDIWKSDYS